MKHFTKCLNLLLPVLCFLGGVNFAWADVSTLTFTAACGGSGIADDKTSWTVTSDGIESTYDSTKGIHYGTGSAKVTYITLSTSGISGTISKIVVNASTASGVSATVGVTVGGAAFGGDAQSLTTSAANYTFEGSASGNIVVTVTKPSKAEKAIYVKSVAVTYTSTPATPTAATPTFSPAAGTYYATQSVSIATETDGATIYYTTDGSMPTTSSSVYSSAISVSSTQTINAIAVKDGYNNSEVATAAYTIKSSLASIALSGTYPTTFTEGDAFSHDGMTVTAIYEDESEADVTANATFSGYSMSTTGAQTVTVSYTENEVTKTATYGITVNAIPTHTVTWSVNGETSTADYKEGATIVFPSDPENIEGKVFRGWVTTPIAGVTNSAPSTVSSATMGTSDITYYAVFATVTAGTVVDIEDELTLSTTGVSGTDYSAWSGKTATSSAVYAGQSAGGNSSIQLRSNNSNSGVISTTSGGTIKKVVLTWNSNTTSGRTVDIYGKNTAYSAATDLYSTSTQGTKLGSIVYGTSTELSVSGDYTYIGLRSNNGALYLDKITITWSGVGPDTYSGYCTTVAASTQVAAPTLSIGTGTYTTEQEVEITCETDGVNIYYTTNGDEPTTSSAEYTAAIDITSTTTLKAIAVKDGLTNSEVSEATYTLQAVAPTFSVEAGEYSAAPSLELSTTTAGGAIYYTTDGTAPTSGSTLYSGAFVVIGDCTVKAVTIKSGWSNSEVAEAAYTIAIEEPTISNVGSNVAITGAEGTTIYYTIDGSTPDNTSIEYTGRFKLAASAIVKAIAYDAYGNHSDVVTKEVSFIAGDIIWAEDFSSCTDGNNPTEGENATYSCSNCTIYTTGTMYAGGTQPEMLISKNGGSMTVTITLNRYYGNMTLTFGNNNDNYTLTTSTTGVTIGDVTKDGDTRTVPITGVPEGTETLVLTFANSTSSNTRVDDFELYATSRSNPSVTVTSVGYATYVSDVDLNFSESSIKAYKVKVNSKAVATLTKVDNVPAGTPVLLYKEGGATEAIPTMTGAAAVTDNDLVAGTGAAVATTDGDYTNMILNNVDDKIGFYFANGQTVAANRAYLHIATTLAPNAESEARMRFVFADDASGIKEIATDKQNDGAIYNLSGQRVNAGYKGIVIKNGKKYLNK